jgi:hypothetical protein
MGGTELDFDSIDHKPTWPSRLASAEGVRRGWEGSEQAERLEVKTGEEGEGAKAF